jgi:type I restriction enzyme S subunit
MVDDIPLGWKVTSLSDLAANEPYAIVDGPFGTQLHQDEYTSEGVPVVRIGNLSFSGRFDPADLVFVSEQKAAVLTRSSVKPGDIVIAKTGATIGKLGMFPSAYEKGIIASSCLKIAVDRSHCNSRFLLHLLASERGQVAILNSAVGTTRTTINIQPFAQIEFAMPADPNEQRRIAEILDAADDAIQQTEQLIAKLKAVKAGLLHDLLTRGLDERGHLRDPQAHPEQFKDSPLGRIPTEWEVAALGEHTTSSAFGPRFSSAAYDENGNVAVLRTTDMDDEGNVNLSTMPIARLDLDLLQAHLLQIGDLLISRSGTCGIAAIFAGFGLPVLPGAFLIRFRLNDTLYPQWIQRYFNSAIGRQQVLRQSQGGVQKNLQGSMLLKLLVPIPSGDGQRQVLQVLDAHDARIRAEEAALAKLRQIKRGLMDDLLTGRVRVTT